MSSTRSGSGTTVATGCLLAANQAGALDLPELRVDRLLAPIEATMVVSDTAFGGIGTTPDPLVMDVVGLRLPSDSTREGRPWRGPCGRCRHQGNSRAGISRPRPNTGAAQGDVPVLNIGGLLDAERLAPSGTPDEFLQRTATGQQWAALPVVDPDTNDFVDTADLASQCQLRDRAYDRAEPEHWPISCRRPWLCRPTR